jgi:excisionase family DNA binding protein
MDESTNERPLVAGMAKTKVLLDTGTDKIYDLIKAGELDSYMEGNRRKITMESIERLIQRRLETAARSDFQRGRHPFRKGKSETTAA